jgi:putative nucleotidyltransferase with HDIG domain
MAGVKSNPRVDGEAHNLTSLEDPVLQALSATETQYREFRASWVRQEEELRQMRQMLADAQATSEQLTAQLEHTRVDLERERFLAARQRDQARRLAESLTNIHRALFSGDLYALILRACLTLTGATRGLYLTATENEGAVRVRAAIDVEGYPAAPPSDFVRALSRKVVEARDTVVCRDKREFADLPEPSHPSEHFRNCIVAPVVILKNFDGIIVVADKADGDFNEEDIETLLSVGDQAAVALQNMQLQRDLQNAYLSTVTVLADAVEAKDSYTYGHCELVSRYARLIASRLSLSEYNRSIVCYGALLHDVGKIGVSDGVLNKPGALTPEERELVKSHVRVGHDLIRHVPALESVANVVLHHHEWYNGGGYPDGLTGEAIPIASRIVAVVDAYCAMVTRRSYKEAFTDDRAREELRRFSGTQFDPRVVEAFLEVLDTPEASQSSDGDVLECGLLPGFTAFTDQAHAN